MARVARRRGGRRRALIGACAAATETNEQCWDRIETVQKQASEHDSPHVLHCSAGLYGGAATAGSATSIHELITTAGGTNVAVENGLEGGGELNEEAIVEWNPDVIVAPDEQAALPEIAALESTAAVQNDQVIRAYGNYPSQPASRIVIALETLADAFAGELADREQTAVSDDTDESATSNEGERTARGPTRLRRCGRDRLAHLRAVDSAASTAEIKTSRGTGVCG